MAVRRTGSGRASGRGRRRAHYVPGPAAIPASSRLHRFPPGGTRSAVRSRESGQSWPACRPRRPPGRRRRRPAGDLCSTGSGVDERPWCHRRLADHCDPAGRQTGSTCRGRRRCRSADQFRATGLRRRGGRRRRRSTWPTPPVTVRHKNSHRQGDSFSRPLPRRADRTARPAPDKSARRFPGRPGRAGRPQGWVIDSTSSAASSCSAVSLPLPTWPRSVTTDLMVLPSFSACLATEAASS